MCGPGGITDFGKFYIFNGRTGRGGRFWETCSVQVNESDDGPGCDVDVDDERDVDGWMKLDRSLPPYLLQVEWRMNGLLSETGLVLREWCCE